MADGVDTQILVFDSPPPSPSSSTDCELGDMDGDRYQGFQDTVPFDDTEVVDSPLAETHLEELCFDTEVVDESSSDDGEEEVVLDSEDERNSEPTDSSSLYGKAYSRRGGKGSSFGSESTDGEKDVLRFRETPQALEFVDNLIKLNNVNVSQGNEPQKIVKEKSQPVSCLRGAQKLAKIINKRTPVKETFEWEENQQVGEGFSSKRMKSSCSVEGKQSLGTDHDDLIDLPNNAAAPNPTHTFRKLANGSIRDWDGNWISDFSEKGYGVNEIGKDISDMYDIGIGTQIAVEAIEALACAFPGHAQAGREYQGPETTFENNSSKGIMDAKARLEQHSLWNTGTTELVGNARSSIRRKRSTRISNNQVERTNNVNKSGILGHTKKVAVVETVREHLDFDLNASPEEIDIILAEEEPTGRQVAALTSFPKGKRTRCSRVRSHFDASSNIHARVTIIKEKENIDSFRCMKLSENDGNTSTTSPVRSKDSYNKIPSIYRRKSCNRNLPKSSLLKELVKLSIPEQMPGFTWKDLRKRRDSACTRVLFSQHLDDDVIKQQKKITAKLGISTTSNAKDATHFIADTFARTKNMLEAIAAGKPVVTHLWLENSAEAGWLLDEKNYILRDDKKEKEIGFSMPVSLARASQFPLLKGRRLFITPNVKPSKEMITSLVKAVQGQAIEGSQILSAKNKISEDLLILSSELDEDICKPFLKKGAAVYSSELLLNGIVIQKLEYERHRIFTSLAEKR